MNAIVCLLGEDLDRAVRTIWDELARDFGVTVQYANTFTHFSLHVADDYDLDELIPVFAELACDHPPFTVSASGLGVFTGERPVLFVPVVRNPTLDALHQAVFDRCTRAFGVSLPYYAPDAWVPHITLAQGPTATGHLGEIVGAYVHRELDWTIHVDNLAVIEDGGLERGLRVRAGLGG